LLLLLREVLREKSKVASIHFHFRSGSVIFVSLGAVIVGSSGFDWDVSQ
jgi:hypothetical protein